MGAGCSGSSGSSGGSSGSSGQSSGQPGTSSSGGTTQSTNGVKDGSETDVDCGGADAPKCAEGKTCAADSDCDGACNYAKKCVGAPSCTTHLGGDTCGVGEVGEPGAKHESCCRTLPVTGFTDAAHPGKKVYLDKYEITAGRIRAWITQLAAANGGKPDVKAWINAHRPQIWDPAWDAFLPSDMEGPTKVIGRRLLGDPRPEDSGHPDDIGPGVIPPPATDQEKHLGINYQFGSEVYVDLHGGNCGTYAGSYGFPTYYYPDDILARDSQVPRASGLDATGKVIPTQEYLDVKSMNCITNEMLAAFCAWDGGQLATDEVIDYVTAAPPTLGNISGCGIQIDNHGNLLGNNMNGTVQTGGRCPAVSLVNATFDAGDNLPVAGSPLNQHNYHYPDTGSVTHDKAWEVSAPGRASIAGAGAATDMLRINPADEPWMDLHGNLNEAALDMSGATFTGNFAMKNRGIGYGSARSDLNTTLIQGETVLRLQRPEAKAAYIGGRCMRFR
ncbi:MAG: hypothetical protein JWP97_3563 [Labilithrix sp.]|nr:hypothetical protein [Labilithrix sp.]